MPIKCRTNYTNSRNKYTKQIPYLILNKIKKLARML